MEQLILVWFLVNPYFCMIAACLCGVVELVIATAPTQSVPPYCKTLYHFGQSSG